MTLHFSHVTRPERGLREAGKRHGPHEVPASTHWIFFVEIYKEKSFTLIKFEIYVICDKELLET
jgi:hypothetical protein